MSIIFPASYHEEILPQDWKKAVVMPIYKKGSKQDPGNYRPVSLTSIPCELMGSIIREELLSYLRTTTFMSKKQHEFLHGRSCITNLLETLEEWTEVMENGYGIP